MPSINTAFLLLAAFLLLHVPTTNAEPRKKKEKIIVLTNNHTNFLSARCFSFNNELEAIHLAPWGQYKFRARTKAFYPSSIMYNCSTNMGTFVAYKYDYECSRDKYDTCDWRFDEDSAYIWDPKANTWFAYDYAPNYESLDRAGVIKGFFAN